MKNIDVKAIEMSSSHRKLKDILRQVSLDDELQQVVEGGFDSLPESEAEKLATDLETAITSLRQALEILKPAGPKL